MIFIISALTFLAASLLVAGALHPRYAAVSKRIAAYIGPSDKTSPEQQDMSAGFIERVVRPALATLGSTVSAFAPKGALAKIRAKLDMAGNPRFPSVAEYIGLKLLSVAAIIPLGLSALHYLELDGLLRVVALGTVAGIAFWLPDIVLQRIIETRQAAIRRALPDVLDLLVVSVEAGIGFDGAMQRVVERSRGPLADEMARALEQVRLGRSRAEAMRNMGQRTQVPDLISFVAAVQQAETMGISIAKILRVQADTARKRRSERAREAAAKLPVRLLFPLVFFIFPALFVVILGPAAIRFSQLFTILGK